MSAVSWDVGLLGNFRIPRNWAIKGFPSRDLLGDKYYWRRWSGRQTRANLSCFNQVFLLSSEEHIGYTTIPSLRFLLTISVFPCTLASRVISSNSPNANSFLYAMPTYVSSCWWTWWVIILFRNFTQFIHCQWCFKLKWYACSDATLLHDGGQTITSTPSRFSARSHGPSRKRRL